MDQDNLTIRSQRPHDRRVEIMLGAACLILAVACLLLAGTIALGTRSLLAKQAPPQSSQGSVSTAAPASTAPASEANDAQIRQTVMQELHEVSCCESLRNGKVSVIVNRGEVTLSGDVPSIADRNAAVFLAHAANGVGQVQDNIVIRAVPAHSEETSTIARAETAKTQETHTTNAVVRPTPAHHEKTSEDEREAQTWVDLGNKELNTSDTPNYDSAIQYFKLALAVDSKNVAARKGLDRAEKAKKAEAEIMGGHS